MASDLANLSSDESNDSTDSPATSSAVVLRTIPFRRRPTPPRPISAAEKAKRKKLAEEKAAKENEIQFLKVFRQECMKYMNVEGHPTLWSTWWCADVSREVSATGARVVPAPDLCHPSLVVWSRNVPRTLQNDNGQLKLSPSEKSCSHALYVTSAEELTDLVNTHTLATHLAEIRTLADRDLTLVIFGVKEYFKSPKRKTSNSNRTSMSEVDLELAITDLLVTAQCDTLIVNTPNELAQVIVQYTKAIAEAPYKKAKRACDEQAAFYMRGDNRKCVAVDKEGVALGKLWQQMLAILPLSGLETSRAICLKYKSPLSLYLALQAPDSVNELADMGVSRTVLPGCKARRLGPEFARKLKILFTSHDGNELVD